MSYGKNIEVIFVGDRSQAQSRYDAKKNSNDYPADNTIYVYRNPTRNVFGYCTKRNNDSMTIKDTSIQYAAGTPVNTQLSSEEIGKIKMFAALRQDIPHEEDRPQSPRNEEEERPGITPQ